MFEHRRATAGLSRAVRNARIALPAGQRLHQRQDVLVAAAAGPREATKWHPCRVVDLSELGCGIEGCGALPEGSTIAVALPGFAPRRARVMWSHANRAGCRFDRPLPEAIFDHIIHMSDPRARG